jgi:glycine oxidase
MNLLQTGEFDAIIIGGGVIGLAIARELKKGGIGRIAVFEKNAACGLEASNAAAGMLAPQAEADCANDFFKFCSMSRDLYPNFAAELFDETGVDIELDRTGTLYLAFSEDDLAEIERRFAWQRAAGLPVEKLSDWEIFELEPNVSKLAVGALRFPLDWQVENRKLNEALIKSIGGNCFSSAQVASLIYENGKVTGVETASGENFTAPFVIVASGAWTSLIDFPGNLADAASVAPVRGQMMSFADDARAFRHVVYSARGYVVPRRKSNRILVGATIENAGFENRATGAGLASLLQTAFEISPLFQKMSVGEIWSGLRPKSFDGLPLLGEFPENSNLYWATGHYRNGILLTPATAKLIAEEIRTGKKSEFLQPFNPVRFQN